ncbi:hypothetical protein [Zavarzinella formosa]|uniref:hypothetical protein n=1 Tax=Zavarzinella formosa TaxID=360055 RepID=UPI0002E203CE|nr:hypothetical protein [Zavarzinella formosa]
MAQTYTLDEAAAKLSLSLEEFKRRLRTEWTQIRSFRDGNTLRFRANEIDELARTIGLGSSAELQLADSDEIGLLGDDAKAAPKPVPAASKKPAPPPDDEPLNLDSDEVFLLTGDEAPKPAKPGSSKKLKGKSPADSDLKLKDSSKGKKPAPPPVVDDDESILSEDEFELPSGMSSAKMTGKSGQLSSIKLKSGESGAMPKPGESGRQKAPPPAPAPVPPDSSEFELSLDADSDDFELSMMPDSSEEVALGGDPLELKRGTGQSGINLNRPADSGVSLEGKKSGKNLSGKSGKNIKAPPPKSDSDDEIDFELSIDSTGSSAKKLSGKKLQQDSDSEFELSIEESSDLSLDLEGAGEEDKKGDIFEATDFEIPALEDDSASEAISLDDADTDLESSEFDLAIDEDGGAAIDESASEVVSIDEEDVQSKKKKLKNKKKLAGDDEEGVDFDDMELESGSSASQALTGVNPEADEDAEEYEVSEASEDGTVRPAGYAPPTPWGPLPVALMLPTMFVMFIGALMAYELLHGMWGYQQSTKPTTPLLTSLADALGMKPNTQ